MKSVKKKTEDEKNETTKLPHATTLFVRVEKWQWPIVYHPEYNIGFMGLEKLHPFDAAKWGRVHEFLIQCGMLQDHTSVRPQEATLEDLMVVHPKRYIDSLKWSVTVAGITEIPPVALMPNFLVQRKVLRPFRYHVGGTVLAAKLAIERGWAINIGGGFHHCCADRGGGFCAYADITLAIKFLQQHRMIEQAMIIDLDAHQGNGHERDFMNDKSVYILDIYNRSIYPHDGYAKRGISRKIELSCYTEDEEYLQLVKTHCEGALNEFKPDLVIYNAGTDVLDGDPLGCLSISPQGIVDRDEIVFRKALSRGIPILMVTSGGYQKTTAQIIANSIINLHTHDLIDCPEAVNAPPPPTEEEPPPPQANIKRSTSESTGFFSRLRRSTNCFSMPRSQTSLNNLSSSQPRIAVSSSSDDSSDDDFPPPEMRPGVSEPDIRLRQDWVLNEQDCEQNVKSSWERNDSDNDEQDKMSLAEALSGLRHEVPRSLESIKMVQCRVNNDKGHHSSPEVEVATDVAQSLPDGGGSEPFGEFHTTPNHDSDESEAVPPRQEEQEHECESTANAVDGSEATFENESDSDVVNKCTSDGS